MSTRPQRSDGAAPFAYEGLEHVIHEKARLGIVSSLATHAEGLGFAELKQFCALTDGNLNRHLQVLQDAGLVEVRKHSTGSRPQTHCRLTPLGRRRFENYISVLEQVVGDAVRASQGAASAVRGLQGWTPA